MWAVRLLAIIGVGLFVAVVTVAIKGGPLDLVSWGGACVAAAAMQIVGEIFKRK